MSSPPSFIPLPLPPVWSANMDSAASPSLFFYTPPTSPNDHDLYFTPPTSPFADPPPVSAAPAAVTDTFVPDPNAEDVFPLPSDMAIDLAVDGESLSILEKIYLYSRSRAYYHRIFIVHKLSEYLDHVIPQEAVEYVLPLLSGLAMDEDDSVKEALADELVPVIWWFFSHCQVIPEELTNEEMYASSSSTMAISVQAFTPILGTLLLNENKRVGILARDALVGFLAKMNKVDEKLLGIKRSRRRPVQPWELPEQEDEEPLPYVGLFGSRERDLFRQEILQQIVVGMGQLDDDEEVHHHQRHEESHHQPPQPQPCDWSNPYFPPVSTPRPATASITDSHATRTSPSHSPSISQRNSPIPDYSPGVEFPPGATSSSPGRSPARTESISRSAHDTPKSVDNDVVNYFEDQGTLGRIACMSLIAAVTAGGPLDDDTLRSFLDEVERVVHDPYFKVRQAASFALGALAKELPEELVPRLMPLFDSLRWDTVWVVRHSALFALPAILGRLSPAQRRTVALETVVALSADKHATVRCGVLECLGEVLYTFVNDDSGPPDQLIQLFLGRPEDKIVRIGQKESYTTLQSALFSLNTKLQNHATPLESFYTQGKRPLICAFNFPAVVLTLGPHRWDMLRDNYLDLVQNPNVNVSRTLAASVGEIAGIIGAEKARRDLVDVWRGFLKSGEVDVRMKAVENLLDLTTVVIDDDKQIGVEMVGAVRKVWQEDLFKAWRERECVQKKLISWFTLVWNAGRGRIDVEAVATFRDLLVKGLEDAAANVREVAISNIPDIWALCSGRADVLEAFHAGIRQLAYSPTSRRRMTFVACQQILVSSIDKEGRALTPLDDATLQVFGTLINDAIEGVRIGIARFVALVYRKLLRQATPVPKILFELLSRLSRDESSEVRSFAARASLEESAKRAETPPPENRRGKERLEQVALFSRPPISSVHDAEPNVVSGRMEEKDVHGTAEFPIMDSEVSGFHDNMDVDTSYDTATAFHGQLGLSSNAVSGIYRRSSSSSLSYSYAYDLGVAGGTASEQVQVPV